MNSFTFNDEQWESFINNCPLALKIYYPKLKVAKAGVRALLQVEVLFPDCTNSCYSFVGLDELQVIELALYHSRQAYLLAARAVVERNPKRARTLIRKFIKLGAG